MPNNLALNIPKYTALLIVDKRIYGAILSLFYLSMQDVEKQHIGWILFIGCLASLIFEIPSGYIADKIGHKRTIVLSRIFMLVSTGSFILSTNIYGLIAGTVLLYLGIACMSGSSTAFIYDTLKALGREKDYASVVGKANSLGYAVPTFFMMGASFLAAYDYKYIFMVGFVLDLIGLAIALSLKSVEFSVDYKKQVKETKFLSVLKEYFTTGFAPYALLGAFMGGVLIGMRGFVDPFQEFAGADVALFGIFLGLSRLASGVVSFYSGQIKASFTINSFHLFRIILFSALFISLGFVESWQTVVGIMVAINTINLGLHEVSKNFDLDIIGDSKFKATLLSIKSQVHQGVQGLVSLWLGYMVVEYTYAESFMELGMWFYTICIVILFYAVRKRVCRA